ncbi:DUF6114 domain-containing protein [Nocardiopsis sp. NPDC049922]|uniref:DUF6114 domain-containing protein n=1 Tax=Nocardiopsis sp. NPDC049922 TaxID=3155157 RepID=UPI0033E5912C
MLRPIAASRAAARGFRHWRWSRPFWGGLLLVVAGAEVLAVPTARSLVLPPDLLVVAGLAGSSHYLIGALLVVNGLMSWAQPAHHAFHGVVGVLLALAAFTASNFGGFVLGTLVGVTGGAMVFAWSASPGRGGADAPTGRAGGRFAWLRPTARRASRGPAARTRRGPSARSAGRRPRRR